MSSWPRKIEALKRLLSEIGSLWPAPSTRLAGYAEDGPYHCEDCIYLKKDEKGNPVRTTGGRGLCNQEVMKADPQVQHDSDSNALVNIERGCCEFVDPPKAKK